jgi:electron transport complex protein RnfG
MNQILRITIGLTITCLIAALVMGSAFTITDRAKKHNEHMNKQETMLGLLGYGKEKPAPSELHLYTIYRYIIQDGEKLLLGYLVPVTGKGGKGGIDLLTLSVKGDFAGRTEVPLTPEAALEAPERQKALNAVLKPPRTFSYADSAIVAKLGDKRLAYLLPGEFTGFKTFIKVMLALDPSFDIMGLEIMEHEEDPGLGGEIGKEYFKNQFRGKPFEKVKELSVVKEPLPDEYRRYLETDKWKKGQFTEKEIEAIRSKYRDKDIYALTGATISSRCVTDGVKNMVRKFAYRVNILDNVIAAQKVPVAF